MIVSTLKIENSGLNTIYLGVPLRVGLCATILCLSGQSISTAIPNANSPLRLVRESAQIKKAENTETYF
jgi:hypothetical protein